MNVVDINNLTISQIREFTDDFDIPIYKRMHLYSASGNKEKPLNWGKLNQNSINNISYAQINNICHYPEALPSLINYSFNGKKVMVLGSSKPWLEILLLRLGAECVKTVEYRKIQWKLCDQLSKKWESFTFNDLIKNGPESNVFEEIDCFVSYSSLEHSGLGRYGDEIDPHGDLNTLALVKRLISKEADFLIAFPLGRDSILFNRHRVYGKKRLKKICKILEKSNVSLLKPSRKLYNDLNISSNLTDSSLLELLETPCGDDGIQRLLRFY